MPLGKLWIGIGAFALATMGAVNADPPNRDLSWGNVSLGGMMALAQKAPTPPASDPGDDDGPDDDGPDDDGPDDGGPDDDGPDEYDWYSFCVDQKLTIRIRGTVVWLVPRGVCFKDEVAVAPIDENREADRARTAQVFG